MDMNEATSKAIAAERSAAHLTIKELAKKANLNERTLIRLLQNERNINVIQLAQLAEVFGVYPHELIEAAERFIERAERGPVSLSVEPDSDDATARDYYAMAAKHGDILFEAPGGGYLRRTHGPNTTSSWFYWSKRRAGIEGQMTVHDLRHTAASLMVKAGANVKAVQRQLGHASAAMTLDVYADLFDDDLDAVGEAVNAMLLENVGKMWARDAGEAA